MMPYSLLRAMISSFSFLYLRSCEGDSDSLCSWLAMSCGATMPVVGIVGQPDELPASVALARDDDASIVVVEQESAPERRRRGRDKTGDTVEVRDAGGKPLAKAAFSPKSQIRARVWTFGDEEVDTAFFRDRIARALALREALPASRHTNALRLVHGESDGLPGLIVEAGTARGGITRQQGHRADWIMTWVVRCAGGGVPPLAVKGPMASGPEAMKRAVEQIKQAVMVARETNIPIAQLPPGYELVPIGFDPEKGQMTDARRFQVEEIARIYNLPPVFLQDLTHGTFSNTEQQDLHLVKHLVAQWAEAFEQECNLKLFGQRNGGRFVEHNLDGLLRGDFKTRAEAVAALVNCAVYKPEEGRGYMGQEPSGDPLADKLYMQGATLPLDKLGEQAKAPEPPTEEEEE